MRRLNRLERLSRNYITTQYICLRFYFVFRKFFFLYPLPPHPLLRILAICYYYGYSHFPSNDHLHVVPIVIDAQARVESMTLELDHAHEFEV